VFKLHNIVTGYFQVTKLNNQSVQKSLLAESKDGRASYVSMKKPDGKQKVVNQSRSSNRKDKNITQVEVPTEKKRTAKKGKSSSSTPTADRADVIAGKMKVASYSGNAKSKKTKIPTIKKISAAKKGKVVKSPTKAASSKSKSGMPSAKSAKYYTDKMPTGSSNLRSKESKNNTVKPPKVAKLNGTTKADNKEITPKITKYNKKASQVNKPSGGNKPVKTIKWETNAKGTNVVESVQIVINGKPKKKFGIINCDVVDKLVESYERFGYNVELHSSDGAWKKDRILLKAIFESMDAKYNNAPSSAKRASKAALNRLFKISKQDYNRLYESKNQFAQTIVAAFKKIMEQADTKYRNKLHVVEGFARIEKGDDIIDIDIITEARNTDMALRNFKNEIIQEYGFGANIKHIFIEGKKYNPKKIKKWSSK